jgi:amidase
MGNAILLEAIAGANGLDDRHRAGTPFSTDFPSYPKLLLETRQQSVLRLRIGILKEGVASPILDPQIGSKFQQATAFLMSLALWLRK